MELTQDDTSHRPGECEDATFAHLVVESSVSLACIAEDSGLVLAWLCWVTWGSPGIHLH